MIKTDILRFRCVESANAFVNGIYFAACPSLVVASCEERDGVWVVEIHDHSWDEESHTVEHDIQP